MRVPMRRLWPRTFFAQLVLGTIAVQTLLLGAFITYIVISQRDQARDRTRLRMEQQLSRLSNASGKAYNSGDMDRVRDVLELAEIAPTIEATRLTDLAGKTLVISKKARSTGLDKQEVAVLPTATVPHIFSIGNGQLEAVTPVYRDGKPVALLWLEPNASVTFNTADTISRIALTYGAFALLANLLPIFLIVRTMTRPLRTLSRATQSVLRDSGPGGTAFPLPVTSSNEAGLLTVHFNTMVRELEQQRSGLLETLALLDSMLGNAPIGFAFFDSEFRYVRLNGFFADVSARGTEDHLGLRPTDIYAGTLGNEMELRLATVFASGEAERNIELTADAAVAGTAKRTWLMSFYPVRTKTEAVRWAGVIVTEITERLQAEETLRKTEKLAAAGRLAASVAHEINNPLESVTNLLYILQHHEPMDTQAIEFITTAQAELARVSEITQQTLRFYRQSVSRSNTNIAEIMNSIVTLYQPRMTAAHVAVVKKFDGDATLFCFGGEMRQLLANLIVNAVDAMPAGGTLTLRVRRGRGKPVGEPWSAGIHVVVADNGMGMSEATRARIFEAFFTTKSATGTGLGLWVSDEIIRKHGGTVRVRSRQGEKSGTCFWMFFPDGVAAEKAVALEG
jgi:signal transduction histidine kinase